MEIYIVLYLVTFFFSLKGIGKSGFLFMILIMALILGFRDDQIGEDTHTYVDYYNSFRLNIISGYMEKGWNLIAAICKIFQLSAFGFNFVVAILTLIPYYKIAIRYNDKRMNGYVLFFLYSLGFYLLMFNGMRQFLAMSFLLIGFDKLQNGHRLQFIVITVLASFIHLISLCVIPLFFISSIHFTTIRVFLFFLLTYIIGLAAGEALAYTFAGKFAHHIEESGIRSDMLFSLTVGLLTNLLFIWLYITNKCLKNNGWVRLSLVSVVVLNLMSNLVIGSRLVYIFSICTIFALSLYLRYTKKIVVRFVIYLYALITFARYMFPEILRYGTDGGLIPYSMNLQLFAN